MVVIFHQNFPVLQNYDYAAAPQARISNRGHEVFFFQKSSLVIIFLLTKGVFQLSSGTDHADHSHHNENIRIL